MKTAKEIIREKKAMLEVVENIIEDIETRMTYPTREIERLESYIKDYKDDNPDWQADDWDITSREESINGYRAGLDAYKTVLKTLEKLI